jgi:hypothetical protein
MRVVEKAVSENPVGLPNFMVGATAPKIACLNPMGEGFDCLKEATVTGRVSWVEGNARAPPAREE